jgi:hypothetical protein
MSSWLALDKQGGRGTKKVESSPGGSWAAMADAHEKHPAGAAYLQRTRTPCRAPLQRRAQGGKSPLQAHVEEEQGRSGLLQAGAGDCSSRPTTAFSAGTEQSEDLYMLNGIVPTRLDQGMARPGTGRFYSLDQIERGGRGGVAPPPARPATGWTFLAPPEENVQGRGDIAVMEDVDRAMQSGPAPLGSFARRRTDITSTMK